MQKTHYRDELASLLISGFIPAGHKITSNIQLDPLPESAKYAGLIFGLDERQIVYRKGKLTRDRPGAFLAIWQRPSRAAMNNKPVPLTATELDYLFVDVEDHGDVATHVPSAKALVSSPKRGMFIFPVSVLIEKGLVASEKSKGKTGFRVFPPWSQDRGDVATQIFSHSGKKTQAWQLPYFIAIDDNGLIDAGQLTNLFLR